MGYGGNTHRHAHGPGSPFRAKAVPPLPMRGRIRARPTPIADPRQGAACAGSSQGCAAGWPRGSAPRGPAGRVAGQGPGAAHRPCAHVAPTACAATWSRACATGRHACGRPARGGRWRPRRHHPATGARGMWPPYGRLPPIAARATWPPTPHRHAGMRWASSGGCPWGRSGTRLRWWSRRKRTDAGG